MKKNELAPAPDAPRSRILVIDDEASIGTAVRRMLSKEHEVTITTSARDALRRLKDERFAVILCDLMMPDMTGMDLHAALETESPDQAAKMIFMTGGAFTFSARAFLERIDGARLEKPFSATDLRNAVHRLLSRP